jgi:type 1 fimbria pilin
VKRLFSNLPIGDAVATDSTGVATFEVPQDIPSRNGKLTIFANIVDDENYMNTEASGEVNWGTVVVSDNSNVGERSISGGRSEAPIYFIISSLLAIGLVWGTLLYAVLQVFKIKRLGTVNKN